MKAKLVIGFAISLISLLGINFIPVEMFIYRDFSGESAMLFYAMENIVAVGFAVIFVLAVAPEAELAHANGNDKLVNSQAPSEVMVSREKRKIVRDYLRFSVGFTASSLIFLTAFIFLVLKTQIQVDLLKTALAWILGFQLLNVFGTLLTVRPLTLRRAEIYLKQSMGRVALLFISVFIGMFLAIFVDRWFIVPFILLKTLADIGEQFATFKAVRS